MATVRLPDRPSFDQLRNQARDLQRAVRAGDADAIAHAAEHDAPDEPATFRLAAAQLVIARHYGFPSWARLKRHLEMLVEYTRVPDELGIADDIADEFIRLACLNYGDDSIERHQGARRLLAEHPEVAWSTIFTAATNADADEVRRRLEATRHWRALRAARSAGRRCSISPTPVTIPMSPPTLPWRRPASYSIMVPTRTPATCGTG